MTTIDLACHDAACAPPPVGTGGSKPGGPSRGALSPKASERTHVPVPVTTSNYELRKHGLRELFDGEVGRSGLSFGDETDVRWLDDDKGWFIEGSLVDSAGNYVGHFERYIQAHPPTTRYDGTKVPGTIVAKHETLIIEDEYQGRGYAKALNDHLLAWYQKVGVDRIELTAGFDMGPYVWATQGYRIKGEGGENRKRWVDDRLKLIEQRDEDPELRAEVRALRKANDRGEDIQPIHIASIGQDDSALHWKDEKYGTMWPGKAVLIDENYHDSYDRSREWDGVYYLEGKEVPATVASARNFLLTR